jgi:hypothetical protein
MFLVIFLKKNNADSELYPRKADLHRFCSFNLTKLTYWFFLEINGTPNMRVYGTGREKSLIQFQDESAYYRSIAIDIYI